MVTALSTGMGCSSVGWAFVHTAETMTATQSRQPASAVLKEFERMIMALIGGRLDEKWSNFGQCTSGRKDPILHVQQGVFWTIQVLAPILKE